MRAGNLQSLRLLCITLVLSASVALAAQDHRRDEHHHLLSAARANPAQHFQQWMQQHAKAYSNDAKELLHRFKVWSANLEFIMEYNAKHSDHWLGLNSLADLTSEEYSARLGYDHAAHKASNRAKTGFKYSNVDLEVLPPAIDWRKRGAVTPVKNQAQCGSCWAFSTTGSVEGINAIVSKTLVSLSEQELVDCDLEQDHGCQGGLMDYAFQFIVDNGGLDTEDDYPYTAMQGECELKKRNRHVVSIDGFEDVPENNEAELKKAVAHQPVSVAIEADQKAFQLYMGGVFSDNSCGTALDHGVLIVGYGTDAGAGGAYWTVKNSWGPEWGESGYIRLKRNVKDKEGMCGIAMVASYPIKTGPNPDPGPTPGPDPGPKPKPPPPPPTPPQPIKCDESSDCPPSTTCCCLTEIFNLCLQWGCCPITDAVCCDDNQHCCPKDLPVCDTAAGRCLPGKGSIEGSQPWLTKTPATTHSIFDRIFKRGKKSSSVPAS